jgi:hypothetical protein
MASTISSNFHGLVKYVRLALIRTNFYYFYSIFFSIDYSRSSLYLWVSLLWQTSFLLLFVLSYLWDLDQYVLSSIW